MSQNLHVILHAVVSMNQPNFLHELKWLGCKLSMVGSPF